MDLELVRMPRALDLRLHRTHTVGALEAELWAGQAQLVVEVVRTSQELRLVQGAVAGQSLASGRTAAASTAVGSSASIAAAAVGCSTVGVVGVALGVGLLPSRPCPFGELQIGMMLGHHNLCTLGLRCCTGSPNSAERCKALALLEERGPRRGCAGTPFDLQLLSKLRLQFLIAENAGPFPPSFPCHLRGKRPILGPQDPSFRSAR